MLVLAYVHVWVIHCAVIILHLDRVNEYLSYIQALIFFMSNWKSIWSNMYVINKMYPLNVLYLPETRMHVILASRNDKFWTLTQYTEIHVKLHWVGYSFMLKKSFIFLFFFFLVSEFKYIVQQSKQFFPSIPSIWALRDSFLINPLGVSKCFH